jgi:hypothetical protein
MLVVLGEAELEVLREVFDFAAQLVGELEVRSVWARLRSTFCAFVVVPEAGREGALVQIVEEAL